MLDLQAMEFLNTAGQLNRSAAHLANRSSEDLKSGLATGSPTASDLAKAASDLARSASELGNAAANMWRTSNALHSGEENRGPKSKWLSVCLCFVFFVLGYFCARPCRCSWAPSLAAWGLGPCLCGPTFSCQVTSTLFSSFGGEVLEPFVKK
jgi:hypothetical protein